MARRSISDWPVRSVFTTIDVVYGDRNEPRRYTVRCACQTPMNVAVSFAKRHRLKQQRHQFNATSTYALFSDIPTPYFAGRCRRDADVVERRMTSITDRLLSKDRAVAWFATHCWTSSKRERYNTAQNKHIYLVGCYSLAAATRYCPIRWLF